MVIKPFSHFEPPQPLIPVLLAIALFDVLYLTLRIVFALTAIVIITDQPLFAFLTRPSRTRLRVLDKAPRIERRLRFVSRRVEMGLCLLVQIRKCLL